MYWICNIGGIYAFRGSVGTLRAFHQSVLLPYYNADDLFPARLVGMLVPNTCVLLDRVILYRCRGTGAGRVRWIDIDSHSNLPHPYYLPTFTMSASQDSLHRHWKKAPPNNPRYGPDRQVLYDWTSTRMTTMGMLDIMRWTHSKPKDEARTHWRRFPAAYLPFLKRFFYRFDFTLTFMILFTAVIMILHSTRTSVRCLKQ